MVEEAKNLIYSATGYEVPEADSEILHWMWDANGQKITNSTAQEHAPEDLEKLRTHMTAADYISSHISQIAEACDMSAVKSIKEGEVSVDMAGSSPEAILANVAAVLRGNPEEQLACFRKLRW